MKSTYSTSEIAKIIGIHPNTVRLYEEIEFITKPKRKSNGYRIFTDLHMDQFRIARLALEVEVPQSGLRKQAINIIKMSARCDFDKALKLTSTYLENITAERHNAEEAISIVEHILLGDSTYEENCRLTRKEAADYLHITIDTLRNWELNGLFTAKRKENGYRVYTSSDISTLLGANAICAGGVMGLPLVISDYRNRKILKRLKVTPSSPTLILAVQVSIYTIYFIASLLLVYVISKVFFQYEMAGSLLYFTGNYLLVMLSMFSIGMMVGGVAKDMKSASVIASLLYFPMLIFSGATLPYEVMPSALQKIADLLPLTQGIKLIKASTLKSMMLFSLSFL